MQRLEDETLARCFEALRGEPLRVASRDPRLRAQTRGVRFVDGGLSRPCSCSLFFVDNPQTAA